ncbi:MAG TPA: DUF308 domain-containing protein [Caulobacteraceae bacterium]|jgi:uncharacterized membrane protein HdeD (DUF308 family)
MTASPAPLRPHRRTAAPWFIVEGVLLIVLGLLAAALPGLTGVAGATVFGWVLVLAGVFGLVTVLGSRHHAHLTLSLVSGIVALVVGLLIVWRPLIGAVALAICIAAYLLIDGAALIGLALDQRKRGGRRWGWLLTAGVVDLLLGLVILLMGPLGDSVLLGIIIALDLIVAGVALLMLGLAARRA